MFSSIVHSSLNVDEVHNLSFETASPDQVVPVGAAGML
jgi:hypothetical protein